MKKYIVTVPVKATQEVLVHAEGHQEAKEKVLRGEIERELGELRYEELDPEGVWATVEQVETREVDLKWSLWSRDKEFWEARAPGVWDTLEGLTPGSALEIRTAPRKEIRFGSVKIERQEVGWVARGYFESHWDDVEDLGDTLGVPVEAWEGLFETVPRTPSGEPGVGFDFEVQAGSLMEIMVLIDEQEATLLEEEKRAWNDFESTYSKTQEPVEANDT